MARPRKFQSMHSFFFNPDKYMLVYKLHTGELNRAYVATTSPQRKDVVVYFSLSFPVVNMCPFHSDLRHTISLHIQSNSE